MTRKAVAILDRPSPRALCMVPVVVDDGHGCLSVTGLADGSSTVVLTRTDLEGLLSRREGLPLGLLEVPPVENLTGGWVGDEFLSIAKQYGVPSPPFFNEVRSVRVEPGDGYCYLSSALEVHTALEAWFQKAVRMAVHRNNSAIAQLAAWPFPDRDEARAAVWVTAQPERRAAQLEWFARLERDGGNPNVDRSAMERRLSGALRLLQDTPLQKPRVRGGQLSVTTPAWRRSLNPQPVAWDLPTAAGPRRVLEATTNIGAELTSCA